MLYPVILAAISALTTVVCVACSSAGQSRRDVDRFAEGDQEILETLKAWAQSFPPGTDESRVAEARVKEFQMPRAVPASTGSSTRELAAFLPTPYFRKLGHPPRETIDRKQADRAFTAGVEALEKGGFIVVHRDGVALAATTLEKSLGKQKGVGTHAGEIWNVSIVLELHLATTPGETTAYWRLLPTVLASHGAHEEPELFTFSAFPGAAREYWLVYRNVRSTLDDSVAGGFR